MKKSIMIILLSTLILVGCSKTNNDVDNSHKDKYNSIDVVEENTTDKSDEALTDESNEVVNETLDDYERDSFIGIDNNTISEDTEEKYEFNRVEYDYGDYTTLINNCTISSTSDSEQDISNILNITDSTLSKAVINTLNQAALDNDYSKCEVLERSNDDNYSYIEVQLDWDFWLVVEHDNTAVAYRDTVGTIINKYSTGEDIPDAEGEE